MESTRRSMILGAVASTLTVPAVAKAMPPKSPLDQLEEADNVELMHLISNCLVLINQGVITSFTIGQYFEYIKFKGFRHKYDIEFGREFFTQTETDADRIEMMKMIANGLNHLVITPSEGSTKI